MYVYMVHVVHVCMYWTCVFGGVCMCMWLMYDCVCFSWCMSCMYVYIIHVWYMYLLDIYIWLCMLCVYYECMMHVVHVYMYMLCTCICNCKCKIVKFTQHILQTVTNIGLQFLASGLLKST